METEAGQQPSAAGSAPQLWRGAEDSKPSLSSQVKSHRTSNGVSVHVGSGSREPDLEDDLRRRHCAGSVRKATVLGAGSRVAKTTNIQERQTDPPQNLGVKDFLFSSALIWGSAFKKRKGLTGGCSRSHTSNARAWVAIPFLTGVTWATLLASLETSLAVLPTARLHTPAHSGQ